jgi:hypothetical protein
MSQSCTAVCDERISACEAEDSPLLEAVARERLMNTEAVKCLENVLVICELWRLVVAL